MDAMIRRNDDMTIAGLLLVVVMVVGIVIWGYVTRHERATRGIVRAAAHTHMDDQPDSSTLTTTDAWGHPLKFSRIASDTAVTQIIVSSGKDGVFGTEDDIKDQDTDYNKSRIVGKWVSGKAKEFIKGLRDGEGEQTRFEKLTHKEPTSQPSFFRRWFPKDKDQ